MNFVEASSVNAMQFNFNHEVNYFSGLIYKNNQINVKLLTHNLQNTYLYFVKFHPFWFIIVCHVGNDFLQYNNRKICYNDSMTLKTVEGWWEQINNFNPTSGYEVVNYNEFEIMNACTMQIF